ncbi:uncharacterized protein METZ01_LOCUS427962, partial [marine metagenome]
VKKLVIQNKNYTIEDIYLFSKVGAYEISLSKEVLKKIVKSR